VLRFGGEGIAEARLAVQVPAGATVTKATLATHESLLSDRPTGALPAQAGTSRAGVHVGGDGTAAVSIDLGEAISATGIALPFVALAAGSEISVELQEDYRGTLSGKRLAGGTAAIAQPGVARWASVFFDPVVLASGAVWIVLRAAKGEAVWLSAADGNGGLRVLRTADGDIATEVVLPGLAPLYELFSRSGDAVDRPATALAVGAAAVSAQRDGDRATYDLAAALEPLAAAGGSIPLTFTSSVAGTITVDPPHVEYDLES
jgi:hypothetical protein